MAIFAKRKPSDWVVMILGALGFVLGLSGLLNPASQYSMLGIDASSLTANSVVPGLLASGSLSALYVGIMYIYGVLNSWSRFKAYLIFARMVMCLGFLLMVAIGRAPQVFIPAAVWEGVGALFILLALWWDNMSNSKISSSNKTVTGIR